MAESTLQDSASFEELFFKIYAIDNIVQELKSVETEIAQAKVGGKDALDIVDSLHMVFTGKQKITHCLLVIVLKLRC